MAAEADARTAAAWRAIRAGGDVQFAPLPPDPPPAPPPPWLQHLLETLRRAGGWLIDHVAWVLSPLARLIGIGARPLGLGLLALAVVAVIVLAALEARRRWRARQPRRPAESPAWQPSAGAALALLADADRLAAEGRYGEAAHLLLERSVGEIAAARPRALAPSTTTREIARLAELPTRAREAFAVIGREVEASLFARRPLVEADWQRAREAYSAFALADLGGTGGAR